MRKRKRKQAEFAAISENNQPSLGNDREKEKFNKRKLKAEKSR
jgi:hypothetical protein